MKASKTNVSAQPATILSSGMSVRLLRAVSCILALLLVITLCPVQGLAEALAGQQDAAAATEGVAQAPGVQAPADSNADAAAVVTDQASQSESLVSESDYSDRESDIATLAASAVASAKEGEPAAQTADAAGAAVEAAEPPAAQRPEVGAVSDAAALSSANAADPVAAPAPVEGPANADAASAASQPKAEGATAADGASANQQSLVGAETGSSDATEVAPTKDAVGGTSAKDAAVQGTAAAKDESARAGADGAAASAVDAAAARPASEGESVQAPEKSASAAQEGQLASGTASARSADASVDKTTKHYSGTLNLIQGGHYDPANSEKATQQAASSVPAATLQKMKNRLNTAYSNPSTATYSSSYGSYVITVDISDLAIDFYAATASTSDGSSVLSAWLEDVINSNPDLFYMSTAYLADGTWNTSASKICLGSIYQEVSMQPSSINGMKTSYENALQNVLKWIPADATNVQKAKAVHDWIVRNVSYNSDAAALGFDSYGPNPWSAYGALVDKKAVCEGYSLAAIAVLKRVGIEATFVRQWASSSNGHGWNRVNIDGKWYNMDCTFDDPTPDQGFNATPSTTYFLKSDSWFKSHPANSQNYNGWHMAWEPAGTAGTDTAYDSYNWNTSAYTFNGNASTAGTSPTALSVSPASTSGAPITLEYDSRLQLSVSTNQSNVLSGRASWTSSNASVAAVNASGVVTTGNKAGTARITCTLGTKTAYAYIRVIEKVTSIAGATVTWPAGYDFNYTRQDKRPEPTVVVGGKTLKKGTDFAVTYPTDTVNPGVKTATITGLGTYVGTVTKTYTVVGTMSSVAVKAPADVTYNGQTQKQKPTVTMGSGSTAKTLAEGTDYALSYDPSNPVNAGTVTVTVTGKGTFSGTKTTTYKIKAAASSESVQVSVAGFAKYSNGSAVTPKPTVVVNGRTLKEGTDYTVTYANNTSKGQAAVTVKGIGNYSFTKTSYFTINDTGTAGAASWKRLTGQTALDTMFAIVNAGFTKCDSVVIASGEGYWDALSASALAGKLNAPLLLTNSNALASQARSQITRLGAKTAYICGGNFSVNDRVKEQLEAMGLAVKRLSGDSAIDTACEIAKEVGTARSDTAIIATVGTYQDALSIAPYSYATKSPIFLADPVGIDSGTMNRLKADGYKKIIIVGGTYWLPDSIEQQLKSNGFSNVSRLAGADAYDTSGRIATFEVGQGLSPDKMAIATSGTYHDALAGAALCGINGSILVLADEGHLDNINGFAKQHSSEIAQAYIFGGTYWLPESIEYAAKQATK